MTNAGRKILEGCAVCTQESRNEDNFLGLKPEQQCLSGDFGVELLTGSGEPCTEEWGGETEAAAVQDGCQALTLLKQHFCLVRE